MADLIRLRDLPGVERIEQLCRHPPNFKPPSASDSFWELDQVSLALFCVTLSDTCGDLDDDESELRYQVVDLDWPEGQPFWEAIGWDVTNGAGQDLFCLPYLGRQILAATLGYVDGARFHPAADGKAAVTIMALNADDEEAIASALKSEADRFIKGRKG